MANMVANKVIDILTIHSEDKIDIFTCIPHSTVGEILVFTDKYFI